jgi:signal transduction histidine kinase
VRPARAVLLLLATVAVVLTLTAVLAHYQSGVRSGEVHSQGTGLTRALSSLPYDTLVPGNGTRGVLANLLAVPGNADLGYGVVVDTGGHPVAEVVTPGAVVPAASLSTDPSAWFGEHRLTVPGDGRHVREFFGPVLKDGALAGWVRVGFFEPAAWSIGDRWQMLLLVAVPVLALSLVGYTLLRLEMQPILRIGGEIERLARAASIPMDTHDARHGGDLIERLGRFLAAVDARLRDLEQQRTSAVTGSRLLAFRKARVEQVLQSLPDPILLLDDAGQIAFASPRLAHLVPSDPEQAVGRDAAEWCGIEPVARLLARYRAGNEHASRADSVEYAPANAPERRVAVYALPLPALHGSPGTLAVFRDVTQQHLARTAGDEFVAHVSHELKTPLQVLTMYSELLQDQPDGDPALRVEAANAIHDQAMRMAGLIGNLLSISRIEAGTVTVERTRVKLPELLRETVESLSHKAVSAGVTLQLRTGNDLTPLHLDKGLFSIALQNLVGNAIKYNRPGGSVTVTAVETDTSVELRVKDTGIGMSPEDAGRAFDKFARGSDPEAAGREGHGLGLYLTRQVVELHHGEIAVTSEPGVGSEFIVTLRKTPQLLAEALS